MKFVLVFLSMFISNVNANVVTYDLDNIFTGTTSQLTGSFSWTYDEGDFENGDGLFTELYSPGIGNDSLSRLTISFDIGKSIEFSLTQNLDNDGIDITLVFQDPLTPTTGTLLDLNLSKWSIGANGTNHQFVSGGIKVANTSLPGSIWLFLYCIIFLMGFSSFKHTT